MTASRKHNPRTDHYPTKAAVKRAVETARELGLKVVGVEVSREGIIKVIDVAAMPQQALVTDEWAQWAEAGKLG